jgi:ATP-dependent DNA ligase
VGAELCAFDMLELDGEDLRRTRIEERKGTLVNSWVAFSLASLSTSISKVTAR